MWACRGVYTCSGVCVKIGRKTTKTTRCTAKEFLIYGYVAISIRDILLTLWQAHVCPTPTIYLPNILSCNLFLLKKIFGNYSLDRTVDRRRKEIQNYLQLLFGFVLPAQVIRCLFHAHHVVSIKVIFWPHYSQVTMERRDLGSIRVWCGPPIWSYCSFWHGPLVVSWVIWFIVISLTAAFHW